MRILYLSQYFPPEAGATQTRAYEMASNLVELGHRVTVLAEIPNHPSGIVPLEYRGKMFQREMMSGIDVIRVWVKASPVKNFRNRMLFYMSYMMAAVLAGMLVARGHYDLVYASSPPLFVGGAGLALRFLKGLPMVFEVRDLWPESAMVLGEISHPLAIAWSTRLEEACYRRARAIVVVTQGIKQRLIQRGLSPSKLAFIPNGSNVEMFRYLPQERARLRSELGLGEGFIAIYAGIHGLAQGLETVVEAARLLQDEPDVHLLLVGDGPRKAALQELAAKYSIRNLRFLPEQPRERIPGYLSAADLALIPLKAVELFKGALPSKMFDAWACERPVLLSVDGEARRILEEAGGGLFVPPEDPCQMAEAILRLKESAEERQLMGQQGREYTEVNFSSRQLAGKLAGLLGSIIE